MSLNETISGKLIEGIKSDKGFYIGDVCYVLNKLAYYKVWGKMDNPDNPSEPLKDDAFINGKFNVPKEISGLDKDYEFIVARTAYGDGCYEDQCFRSYPVDAGVIGVVPLELCTKIKPDEIKNYGTVVVAKNAKMITDEEGRFVIDLYDKSEFDLRERIEINTTDDAEKENND